MSLIALPQRRGELPGISIAVEIAAEGRRRQPLLWGFAVVLAAMMVPTFAAALLDDRLLNGISVWSKPLKFELAMSVYFATLAWFWGYLPDIRRVGRFINGYAVATVAAGMFEIAYIILQASRGVASHFNNSTLIESAAYSLMGAGAILMTGMSLVLGIALARHSRGDLAPAFRLSVVLGLVLTFVLGTGAGMAIAVNNGHWVAAAHTDVGGFPIFGWTRTGGDLRVGHFFGIHAMQMLPLLGLLVGAGRRHGRAIIWGGAAVLTVFTVATTVQAWLGQPFLGFIH